MAALARRFGISRKTAHKWIRRFAEGGSKALDHLPRAPHAPPRTPDRIRQRILALRHVHPTWGAKKLRVLLRAEITTQAVPSERTISRWLQRCGLQRRRRNRARPGPVIWRRGLEIPQQPNDVWTVDFKGPFRTGDGYYCEPLTVRDLFSRMVLAIEILPDMRDHTLRAAFQRLFRRQGLPATIRLDHGQPFACAAPYGCTALTLWWMRLGIRIDFTRRAKPQDNGSHEQFHRVYKAENLRPPARSWRAQQQRHRRWMFFYNTQRPHESLGQIPPARLYRKSPRRFRPLTKHFHYPPTWKVYRVGKKGTIRWGRRIRLLSRTLAREWVGLCRSSPSTAEVYLEKIHMGTLHLHDLAGMRPTIIRHRKV